MNTKLVSIIVPVYNVEQYLDKCVNSLINQTYKDIEILLIDDGSTDNSGKICDFYTDLDHRVKVYHKTNGGLSDARNFGLRYANGKYIGFVDSDDIISTKMYEILINVLDKNNANLCLCDFITFTDGCTVAFEENVDYNEIKIKNSKDLIHQLLTVAGSEVVWRGLYKKETIENFPFETGRINEDTFWTHQIIGKESNIPVIKNKLYGYRQRKDSILHSKFSIKKLDNLEARYQRINYVIKHFPDLEYVARCDLQSRCVTMWYLIYKKVNVQNRNEYLNIVKDYIKKNEISLFKLLKDNKVSSLKKINIICSMISINLTAFIKGKLLDVFFGGA